MQPTKHLVFTKPVDLSDNIPLSYKGKNVFITGGSGFIGKVLLERLLRSCPDIGHIYLLLREKGGKPITERLKDISKNILFDKCRRLNPNIFDKVIPIQGDVREISLGMHSGDRELLMTEVSIVYHIAATVRFNESLTDAILMNTRGTREVCNLVLDLQHVDAFLHVSTAYSQIDKEIVEEKLYRAPVDWSQMIKITEQIDPYHLKRLMPHLLYGYPNTYTFSKALAENVVADMCEGKVPTIICRPTIVISMYGEPVSGWMDNMNGPNGLIFAASKGVWRSNYVNCNAKIDFMAVDVLILAIIFQIWLQKYFDNSKISVYNCSSQGVVEMTPKTILELGHKVHKVITPTPLWCPSFYVTEYRIIHLVNIYLFHVVPALIIDLLFRLTNHEPILFNVQRKIYFAMDSLNYFMRHSWTFCNDKTLELFENISEHDHNAFFIDIWNVDLLQYFTKSAEVGAKLIFNEDISKFPRNRKIITGMQIVHYGVIFSVLTYLCIFAYNWIIMNICI